MRTPEIIIQNWENKANAVPSNFNLQVKNCERGGFPGNKNQGASNRS